jgi:hypothetical protein
VLLLCICEDGDEVDSRAANQNAKESRMTMRRADEVDFWFVGGNFDGAKNVKLMMTSAPSSFSLDSNFLQQKKGFIASQIIISLNKNLVAHHHVAIATLNNTLTTTLLRLSPHLLLRSTK